MRSPPKQDTNAITGYVTAKATLYPHKKEKEEIGKDLKRVLPLVLFHVPSLNFAYLYKSCSPRLDFVGKLLLMFL